MQRYLSITAVKGDGKVNKIVIFKNSSFQIHWVAKSGGRLKLLSPPSGAVLEVTLLHSLFSSYFVL